MSRILTDPVFDYPDHRDQMLGMKMQIIEVKKSMILPQIPLDMNSNRYHTLSASESL